ncbi:50S ribosomal protein L15 [Patescibacteria group bacterium]
MQLHQLKPKSKTKSKKRIGRGGKRGTYSGKGLKGQKSRAGRKIRPQLRDIIKRIPKHRGYRFSSIKTKPTAVNLKDVSSKFEAGEEVNLMTLLEKKMISKSKGKFPKVKILAFGNLSKKINFSGVEMSKTAIEKIKKSGGTIK